MLSLLKSWSRSRQSRNDRGRSRRLFLESLEERRLLTSDLSVAKIQSDAVGNQTSGPVIAGDILYYKVSLVNLGPDPATNVELDDNIPANTTLYQFFELSSLGFSISSPGQGGTGQVSATLASFDPGQGEADFILGVLVNPSTPENTTITNVATAKTDDFDPNASNNDSSNFAATVNTSVIVQSDMKVLK